MATQKYSANDAAHRFWCLIQLYKKMGDSSHRFEYNHLGSDILLRSLLIALTADSTAFVATIYHLPAPRPVSTRGREPFSTQRSNNAGWQPSIKYGPDRFGDRHLVVSAACWRWCLFAQWGTNRDIGVHHALIGMTISWSARAMASSLAPYSWPRIMAVGGWRWCGVGLIRQLVTSTCILSSCKYWCAFSILSCLRCFTISGAHCGAFSEIGVFIPDNITFGCNGVAGTQNGWGFLRFVPCSRQTVNGLPFNSTCWWVKTFWIICKSVLIPEVQLKKFCMLKPNHNQYDSEIFDLL